MDVKPDQAGDLYRAYTDIQAAQSPRELHMRCTDFFYSRGIKMASYHYLPPLGVTEDLGNFVLYASGFPKAWVETYQREKLFLNDPIIRSAKSRTRPFLWSELIDDPTISAAERAYMHRLVDAGLGDGLAVPVYGPHAFNGYCGLGFGLGSAVPGEADRVLWAAVCQMAHLRACDFAEVPDTEKSLSPRETQTLRYMVIGFSNAQIAEEMGVEKSTIDTNLRRIYTKLDVHDRVSAAMRAIALGCLD